VVDVIHQVGGLARVWLDVGIRSMHVRVTEINVLELTVQLVNIVMVGFVS
jgi:hypothetical protein